MTVAIAAAANHDRSIIFALDRMVTVGLVTADLPLMAKGFCVHKFWMSLYAGDVTQVPPILDKVKELLTPEDQPTVETVARTMAQVYRERREKLAEQSILNPIGLDMTTFVGLWSNNDNAELGELKRRIQDFEFDCAFLVGGFSAQQQPHIFTIEPPGVESHHTSVKFWSIGSGAGAAINSLLFRRYTSMFSVKKALYHIAEAKYLSETAVGVGKGSAFIHLNEDGTWGLMKFADEPLLRTLWETEGQPPMPDNLEQRVPDFTEVSKIYEDSH